MEDRSLGLAYNRTRMRTRSVPTLKGQILYQHDQSGPPAMGSDKYLRSPYCMYEIYKLWWKW